MIKAVLGVGRVAQVVEWLLNKHKALSSNSNIAKKKKNQLKQFCILFVEAYISKTFLEYNLEVCIGIFNVQIL
jgi:hypothetical protein